MDQYRKNLLDRALTSAGIEAREVGDELTMRCPVCSPRYSNRHLTLSFNTVKEAWQCFRCSNAKGRDAVSFIVHLGLYSYVKSFEDAKQTYIESMGLDEVRRRMLAVPEEEVEEEPVQALTTLPPEYRTDFEATITGKAVFNYLTKKRHMKRSLIRELRIGYAIEGGCNGAAIFPVVMKEQLVFWQARRILFQVNHKYYNPKIDKSVLYGYDWSTGSSAYIVEGIFDAIALKPYSLALLGKTISKKQIALLAEKNIKEATVVLDGDAWDKCRELAQQIRSKLWTVNKVVALRLGEKLDPGDFMGRPLKAIETVVF